MEKTVGIFIGMAAGLAVGIGIVALLFKKKVLDFTFDERQERARGQAFKYGFFTLIGAVLVYSTAEQLLGRWCEPLAGGMLCMCAGMGVFAVACILKDAYLSLREKPRVVMTLFAVISAANLVLGGMYLAEGTLVEDGVLTFRAVNLMAGITTLLILMVYLVNYVLREREGE